MTTLERIGAFAARRGWWVIAGWLLVAGVLIGASQAAGGTFTDDLDVPRSDSSRAHDLARDHFTGSGTVTADVVFHSSTGPLDESAIGAMLDVVRTQPYVVGAPDPAVRSRDGRTAMTTVHYAGSTDELGARALERLNEAAAPPREQGVAVEFRGWVVEAATRPETGAAELVGLGAATIVLVLAFGSLVAAALPLLTSLIGLGTGSALVALVATGIDIPSAAPILAVMLGLGAGIDYALFLVTRFRQQLASGSDVPAAIAKASGTAGGAIVFAGGTVVVAILGLYVSGIPFVGAMGLASAVLVAMMVLAALTLVPAVLGLLGRRVNAGRIFKPRERSDGRTRGWLRWGEHVRRRRWVYAIGATLLLLALSAPLLALRLGMPDDRVQPTSTTNRRAYDLIAANFGPGYTGPLLVTVDLRGTNPAVVDRMATALGADPGVASVTQPQPSADGEAALLTVIPNTAPQDAETADLVHRLRERLVPDGLAGTPASGHIGGQAASMIDLADRVRDRLPWVIGGVVIVSCLLLVAMLRSIVVPLKAAVLTLLSIGAAYGAIVAIFQWGWGLSLLGIDEPVPIMAVVPMFLFAVLFGLSMDYEVFLMSRVREDYVASGDAYRSVVTGLASTGRVITSAAAIMTVVFLSFVGIANPLVKMVGIGLSVAVLVDATLIRMLLVPALMSVFGRAAWWFPARREARSHETQPVP